jgi:predicted GIY-YIG superfamily endonuclease
MQRECEIKQMPRKKKLELVPNTQENAEFLKREFC